MQSAIVQQGFHFTATSAIPLTEWQDNNCSLHLLHVLPADVYADQYELALHTAFSVQLHGSADLELPVDAVDSGDSSLLLKVNVPDDATASVTVDVPLHARYGRPVSGTEAPYHTISLTPPVGFWACPASGRPGLPRELSERVPTRLFSSSGVSVVPYLDTPEELDITIPVGVADDLQFVDVVTGVLMLLMFAYLLYTSLRTASRLSPVRPPKSE